MLSYIFGGIIGLIGVVAAILLFLVEHKISQSAEVLNELRNKYYNNELDYETYKRGIANYTIQWNYVGCDKFLRHILLLFFLASLSLIMFYLYDLCLHLFRDRVFLYFVILDSPLLIFVLIVYELVFAPDSKFFGNMRPSNVMKNQYPFNEITEKYCGYFDVEDIEQLERNRFKKAKRNLIRRYDQVVIYLSSSWIFQRWI